MIFVVSLANKNFFMGNIIPYINEQEKIAQKKLHYSKA